MDGMVGTIVSNGQEVGGFLLWSVDTTVKEGKLSVWKCHAKAFWLSQRVSLVKLRLHSDIEAAWWDTSDVMWPTAPPMYGMLIERPVEIVGAGKLTAGM